MEKLSYAAVLLFLAYAAREDIKSGMLDVLYLLTGGMVLSVFRILEGKNDYSDMIMGLTAGFAMLTVSFISSALGKGDGLLLLAAGACLGGLLIIKVIFIAFILSGICGAFMLLSGAGSMKASMPFVPLVLFAYVLTMIGK